MIANAVFVGTAILLGWRIDGKRRLSSLFVSQLVDKKKNIGPSECPEMNAVEFRSLNPNRDYQLGAECFFFWKIYELELTKEKGCNSAPLLDILSVF